VETEDCIDVDGNRSVMDMSNDDTLANPKGYILFPSCYCFSEKKNPLESEEKEQVDDKTENWPILPRF
jgi:hypothetical protein